jgi:hypothetical protein
VTPQEERRLALLGEAVWTSAFETGLQAPPPPPDVAARLASLLATSSYATDPVAASSDAA